MLILTSLDLPPALALGLSPSASHLLAFLFASSYVGSIYISQHLYITPASSPAPSRPRTPVQRPPSASNDIYPKASNFGEGNDSGPPVPPISAEQASGEDKTLSSANGCGSVTPESGPRPGSRDHPDTIRLRMKAVGVATLSSLVCVVGIVKVVGGYTLGQAIRSAAQLMGLGNPIKGDPSVLGLSYTLAPILFLGPIYAEHLDRSLAFRRPSSLSPLQRLRKTLTLSLIDWRNYVVGPLTEELTFRSCIISTSLLSGLSASFLVFGTPLWFGVAHLHHAREVFVSGGSTSAAAKKALFGCLFQLSYTTLFGWFASYLFVRTGSVLPPLASHIFCNIMGIYLPSSAIHRHPEHKWRIIIAYCAGIAGFIYGLRKM